MLHRNHVVCRCLFNVEKSCRHLPIEKQSIFIGHAEYLRDERKQTYQEHTFIPLFYAIVFTLQIDSVESRVLR